MGNWAVDVGDGIAGVGGGGSTQERPWWSFPTPLGVPKVNPVPTTCYQGPLIAPNGEAYGLPVLCGTFPLGWVGDNYWQAWFGGP